MDEGKYIIVPRTSGCSFGRPYGSEDEPIQVYREARGTGEKMREFSALVQLAINDIFSFSMIKQQMNMESVRDLEYEGFNSFYLKATDNEMSELEFNKEVIEKCGQVGNRHLNLRGFNEFCHIFAEREGEKALL